MANMNYDSDFVRKTLDNAHKRAVIIDGFVKVSYRAAGYRVETVCNDGKFDNDSPFMTRREAFEELWYLLCD